MIYTTIEEWIERNPNHIGAIPIEVCRQIWGAKEALAQPQKEPVGIFAKFTDGIWREVADGSNGIPLYTKDKNTKTQK